MPNFSLRILLATLGCTLLSLGLWGQRFFPVKVNKKWGLINAEGRLVLDPVYDAIGEFKHYGYAVMQRQGQVGLLGPDGKEAIPPRYDDIKVLDDSLVAVMSAGGWRVINFDGATVLDQGYRRVSIIRSGFLAYQRDGRWGVVDARGRQVAPAAYDEIENFEGGYFLTWHDERMGLVHPNGQVIIDPVAEEVKRINDSLFLYRQGRRWGAVDEFGRVELPVMYESFRPLGSHFLKLFANDRFYVYSYSCRGLLPTNGIDDFYSFSPRYVITKKDRLLGLTGWCGQEILPPRYQEIQSQGEGRFRVNLGGRWGVVDERDELIIPFTYDYIAPLQGPVCMVKQDGRFGLLNAQGEVLAPARYDRLEISEDRTYAYIRDSLQGQDQLTVFQYDPQGQLVRNNAFNQHFQVKVGGRTAQEQSPLQHATNDYQLDRFEWFYAPANDRWGLRNLASGNVVIEPLFDYIQVEKDLGLTLVGIWKTSDYEFERTTFRFDMRFGLVQNETGHLVTEIEFLDLRFDDFRQGHPLARAVMANGSHGLVDRIGRIVRRDMAFVGAFSNGIARASFSGRLSGAREPAYGLGPITSYLDELLAPSYMLDYTAYDQLFRSEAELVCEDCVWGYIDTCGQVIVTPSFTFAEDMVNDAGIVAREGKWGMVRRDGQLLLPCEYDGIAFLENTGNRMVRVYVERPQYGLIDTLGQLTVSAIYEEIGHFAEGRLAVRRNGLWGFVDADGLEVIPCRFREAQDFSEGLAAVKLGNHWGFIDKNGDWVIHNRYRRVGNFHGGMAWADGAVGFGYINPADEWVIPPAFTRAFDFEGEVARVVSDGGYGLIDKTGRFVLRPRYIEISPFNEHGLAIASHGRDRVHYGLLNQSGQMVTQEDFRDISPFREGLAAVKDRGGYGFVDTTGRVVIPTIFSKAGNFHEGRAVVQRNGKCGYIAPNGQAVVPCAYSRCQDFSGGRAVVYQGIKNAGIIDREGRLIVEPSLDRLLEFQEGRGLMRDEAYRFYYITEQTSLYDGYYERASPFRHGVAVVRINGKWGIINQRGIEIIPPKYDHIEGFEDGYAKVRIEGFNGLSNLDGELLVQPNYELISYAGDGLFRVEQGDKIGYFDSNGRWVWDLTR